MSGHSKWSTIKRQKGANDARRGQLFTKLGREISVAVRRGGPDPDANFNLRLAVQRARDNNMPMDNIERAIKRASGDGANADDLFEVTYEGYGPGGAALMVQAVTDNKNRTVAEVRSTLTRNGGNLGETGSVAWNFDSKGVIMISPASEDPEELALVAIDAGAEDVKIEDSTLEVHTRPDTLESVRKELEGQDIAIDSAELSMIPKSMIELDEKGALQTLRLMDKLENLDDIQRIFSNADFPPEALLTYQQEN